jgi:hypothetical protein
MNIIDKLLLNYRSVSENATLLLDNIEDEEYEDNI